MSPRNFPCYHPSGKSEPVNVGASGTPQADEQWDLPFCMRLPFVGAELLFNLLLPFSLLFCSNAQ